MGGGTPQVGLAILLALGALAPTRLHAQASAVPSAAPATPAGADTEQRGHALIDQALQALGGDAWLNKTTMTAEGRGSSFFHGEPNPYGSEYHKAVRYAQPKATPPVTYASRIGLLTDRSMIFPGKKIDVIQMLVDNKEYEVTYKGKTEVPQKLSDEDLRRLAHSLDAVLQQWIHAPGVMIVYEGQKLIDRHLADQVSVLNAGNDAVTLYLDAASHLPFRSSFQYRDPQFHDFDEESETYDDYHVFQGINTPLTVTTYHNGDMVGQAFLTKVTYNEPLAPDFFSPDAVSAKLKKK
jgi:hypothetical protein